MYHGGLTELRSLGRLTESENPQPSYGLPRPGNISALKVIDRQCFPLNHKVAFRSVRWVKDQFVAHNFSVPDALGAVNITWP